MFYFHKVPTEKKTKERTGVLQQRIKCDLKFEFSCDLKFLFLLTTNGSNTFKNYKKLFTIKIINAYDIYTKSSSIRGIASNFDYPKSMWHQYKFLNKYNK